MAIDPLAGLGAQGLRDRIADGALRSADLARVLVERMAAKGETVAGFAWFDPVYVTRQAEALDRYRGTGRAIGALHGLPVAVSDLIDTRAIPTERGTPMEAGRAPERDAFAVERLRTAGAVLAGKTAVAPFGIALDAPARQNTGAEAGSSRSPSPTASLAVVASGIIPLAIEADTAGATISAAADAGIVGYLPTQGGLSRRGSFSPAPSLAGLCLLGQSTADVAMLCDALQGHDDPERPPTPPPRLHAAALSAPPARPVFAFLRTPFWDSANADTHGAFEELATLLADTCFEAELPALFAGAPAIADTIRLAELSKAMAPYARRGGLSGGMMATLAQGDAILARDYLAALDWPAVLNAGLDAIFARCDAIITPAGPGAIDGDSPTAGDGLAARGFNSLWSLCGLPVITLPAFEDGSGNPIGLQLVARRGDDARLLRNAHWIEGFIADPHREE